MNNRKWEDSVLCVLDETWKFEISQKSLSINKKSYFAIRSCTFLAKIFGFLISSSLGVYTGKYSTSTLLLNCANVLHSRTKTFGPSHVQVYCCERARENCQLFKLNLHFSNTKTPYGINLVGISYQHWLHGNAWIESAGLEIDHHFAIRAGAFGKDEDLRPCIGRFDTFQNIVNCLCSRLMILPLDVDWLSHINQS